MKRKPLAIATLVAIVAVSAAVLGGDGTPVTLNETGDVYVPPPDNYVVQPGPWIDDVILNGGGQDGPTPTQWPSTDGTTWPNGAEGGDWPPPQADPPQDDSPRDDIASKFKW